MSQVIFAKTRYQDIGYQSYSDFWDMVKWAGYQTIYVDQIDPDSTNTYIVTPLNDEWTQGWNKPRARIIHYELEWRHDWRAEVNEPQGVAEVWAADKWLADTIGARYVPMGGDERINVIGNKFQPAKVFDAVLLSYQTPRRQRVTQELVASGLTLAPISGVWGNRRSMVLMQSRMMIHVHQNDNMFGVAPLRWCIAAAHKLPLLTETLNDRGVFRNNTVIHTNLEFIAGMAKRLLANPDVLESYGEEFFQYLCKEYTFKRSIESHV